MPVVSASAFGQAPPRPAPMPDNAQSRAHIEAAKKIAGSDAFLEYPYNFFCIPANARANSSSAPDLEPVQIFDNLYAAGNSETTVYARKQSDKRAIRVIRVIGGQNKFPQDSMRNPG